MPDFSRSDIINALKNMKLNKSAGAGFCAIDIFKHADCPDALLDCITLIFN